MAPAYQTSPRRCEQTFGTDILAPIRRAMLGAQEWLVVR